MTDRVGEPGRLNPGAVGEAVLRRVHAPSVAGDLVDVHERTASTAYVHIFEDAFPRADALARWSRHLGPAVLAAVGGEPVGFAAADGRMLEALYVLPAHHGRGIGSALLQAVGPVDRLWVLEANTVGRAFYERRRWRWSGQRRAGLEAGGVPEMLYLLD